MHIISNTELTPLLDLLKNGRYLKILMDHARYQYWVIKIG